MSRRDEGMVEVELVDDRLSGEPPAAEQPGLDHAGGTPAATIRRSWRSVAVVLTAAAVVVGGLSLGSTYVERAEVRADDARVSAFADVPGVGPSLREPPTERWRLTATSVSSLVGELVMTRGEFGGALRTVARDAATGEARWVAAAAMDASGGLSCRDALADDTLLLCVLPGFAGEPAPNTDVRLGGTPDRLLVLAAGDGSVRAERELPVGTIGWAVLDGDLVLATRQGVTAQVERSDVLTGEVRWSAGVPLPQEVLRNDTHLMTSDGLVVLAGPVASVVDGEDGRVVGTWSSADGSRLPVQVLTSSVGLAVWTSDREGIWFDREGRAGASLVGAPVVPYVTDGSAPRVVLVQDGDALAAVDVQRGPLWERPAVESVPLRLDGRVLLVDDGWLTSVDLGTGQEVWSVELRIGGTMVPPVTDGVRVLVPGYEVSEGRSVTAHDLDDGAALWTMPLPAEVSSVTVGGSLLVGTGNQIAVFD